MGARSDRGGPITGIDLGTTFSSLAVLNAFGRAEVIPTLDGSRSIPSVVLFPPEGGPPLVGRDAKERSAEAPARVVEFVKREMGDPDWRFEVDGIELTPPDVSAIILRALAQLTHDRTGERPRSAVITVPAYFGDLERQATADAGALAGLEVLSTFNEPTAAALAYGLHHAAKTDRVRALVYDLGGGTFDVTVLELEGRAVRVLATAGEHRLGGKDWDDELLNFVAEEFAAQAGGLDPREDLAAQQDLRNRCEAAKVSLSEKTRAKVFCRAYDRSVPVEVTRQVFEELTRPLLLQTRTYVDQVLAAAGTGWDGIDVVLPVGGSSYMPQVRAMLAEASGRQPETLLDPELAVVQGATYYAALVRAEQGFSVKVMSVARPAGPRGTPGGTRPRPAPAAGDVDEDLPALPPASLEEAPELLALPGQVGSAPGPPPPPTALPALAGRAQAEALPGRPGAGPAPPPPPPLPLARAVAPGGPSPPPRLSPTGSSEFDAFGWPVDPARTLVYDFADLIDLGSTTSSLVPGAAPVPGTSPADPFGLGPGAAAAPAPPPRRAVTNVNARPLGVLVYKQGLPRTSVMIRANSALPAVRRSRFFTIKDGQTAVKVVVLEGDAPDPDACTRVGELVITGLPSRPKGQEIEISYAYDADGRIQVMARDLGSGQVAQAELLRATGPARPLGGRGG